MIKKANKKNLFDGKQAIIRLTENQLYFRFPSFTQSLGESATLFDWQLRKAAYLY